jgi:hypothetical protein
MIAIGTLFNATAAPPRSAIEICNNNLDDDGDGNIDEAQCQTSPASTPISGDGVVPELWNDNPNCSDLGFGFGFKVDSPSSGTYTFTSSDGDLTGGAPEDPGNSVTYTISGNFVTWSSTLPIDAVFVKGGPEGATFLTTTLKIPATPDFPHRLGPVE